MARLCGDSTVATDVERVLGGVEPLLMVTDPPYVPLRHASARPRARWRRKSKAVAGGQGRAACVRVRARTWTGVPLC
jgi:hypothetical protein